MTRAGARASMSSWAGQLASLLTLALCGWAVYLTQPYRLALTLVLLLVLVPFAAILPDRCRPWRRPMNKTS